MKKQNKQIKLIKDMIKMVKKDYGVKMCKDFSPCCPNCRGQQLLGFLNDYLDDYTLIF